MRAAKRKREDSFMKSCLPGVWTLVGMGAAAACCCFAGAWAEDRPQWGQRYSRNMVSPETHLPATFDLDTGEHVKWSAPLGANAYGSPVIAAGSVLIGANNEIPRDSRNRGDRGVLLCLNEDDGTLRWQLAVPRVEGNRNKDWPMISICSPPTVEGNRVYAVTNRFEVVCLDLDGQANGNDGPYQDEGSHMVPSGTPPLEVTAVNADILWKFDMLAEIGSWPHDSAHSSILLDGPYLYLNTCNAVDNTHVVIRRPEAPSLIVLDKATGRLVAKDGERIGPRIFHSTWSSPALGEAAGKRLVFFGGGDGVCYAFEALEPPAPRAGPATTLRRVWRFDCDPTAPKENVHKYNSNRVESPSTIKSMPVFYKNRVYLTVTGDIWWGKEKASLMCIDATQRGDITASGLLWSYPLELHCCSTPSISKGLVFVADCAGNLHCLDAETGEGYWTHALRKEVWGSTLVADGKVYVGSRGGDFWILAAAKDKRVLASVRFDDPISTTPVAANGVLYVATQKRLYALK